MKKESEIKKALECCKSGHKCDVCPYDDNGFLCSDKMKTDALDLINRQQAEIEKQQYINLALFVVVKLLKYLVCGRRDIDMGV